MTKLGYTDITFLVDRSGSMQATKNDMEGGFQTYIARQRDEIRGAPGSIAHSRSSQDVCLISITQFDAQEPNNEVCSGRDLFAPFSDFSIQPRGATPLLDAIGTTIEKLGRRLSMLSEQERPDRVLVVTLTDGEENSSITWTRAALTKRIHEQETRYGWNFAYVGANFDAFSEAGRLGASMQQSLSGSSVVGLWASTSSAVARYVVTNSISYTHEERTQSK